MEWTESDLLLVTGATGLVGSHVAETARKKGIRTRTLVRMNSDIRLLQKWGVEVVTGSMTEPYSVQGAMTDVTHVVHCAAKIGEWGRVEPYRDVNVRGLEYLLQAAAESVTLKRLVHVSTMGVYPAVDHHGTDESCPMDEEGMDAYTLTKVEGEKLLAMYVAQDRIPAVTLRPGWVYGTRDRTVLPRILTRMREGKFAFLGSGEQLMNNTYVGNLVDAIFLALEKEGVEGKVFNIADGRLVTKHEFFNTIAEQAGLPKPTRHVPMWLAVPLAKSLDQVWSLLNAEEAPVLTPARVKLLGRNLDYSIEKARRELGYNPRVDFTEGMRHTMERLRKREAAAE